MIYILRETITSNIFIKNQTIQGYFREILIKGNYY